MMLLIWQGRNVMKVAIITLTGYQNIGNRLQNYAVQTILEKYGHKPTTLRYARYQYGRSFPRKVSDFIKNVLEKIGVYTTKYFMLHVHHSPRSWLLRDFDNRYIHSTTKYFFKTKHMKKHKADFDYFCVGSDQVWTAGFVQDHGLPFLLFADSDKTFSFSASMGNLKIPEQFRHVYTEGLNHIGKISVRETEVQDLIKDMVNRDSVVLLDPTLLIDASTWLEIAQKPTVEIPKKYVTTYFLSETTAEQKQFIDTYASAHHCEVVDLNGKYFDHIGPLEFIYLLANADFVFTDSFHGTAFSIIFNKNFAVFQRNNECDMSSRIITVLKTFQLERNFINIKDNKLNDSHLSLLQEIETQSTDHIMPIFEAEKEKAAMFLKDVFNT